MNTKLWKTRKHNKRQERKTGFAGGSRQKCLYMAHSPLRGSFEDRERVMDAIKRTTKQPGHTSLPCLTPTSPARATTSASYLLFPAVLTRLPCNSKPLSSSPTLRHPSLLPPARNAASYILFPAVLILLPCNSKPPSSPPTLRYPSLLPRARIPARAMNPASNPFLPVLLTLLLCNSKFLLPFSL